MSVGAHEPLPESFFYYRLGAGVLDWGDAQFDGLPGSVETDAEFEGVGLFSTFVIGQRWASWATEGPASRLGIRWEVEGVFAFQDYERFSTTSGGSVGDGELFEYGVAYNIMPDVKLGPVSVFAGGGIGASIFTFSDSTSNPFDESRGALMLQVLGGVSVDVTPLTSIYGTVRYRTYSDVIFRDEGSRLEIEDLDGVAFEAGLLFRF
ncbi:MAG: hypothetical protein AAFX79_06935 [Planctomycetota bacterium]